MREPVNSVAVRLPGWVAEVVDYGRSYETDEARMGVAVRLAAENVQRDTGGPFGAAVFEAATGTLVSVGVNRVVPLNNSSLHAEIIALMLAQARIATYSLGDNIAHELFSSCEPCAMCLGATHWSGVSRVVWAATREDAGRLHFDEGPVFQATYDYLSARGIQFEAGPLRSAARDILARYGEAGGEIYNG